MYEDKHIIRPLGCSLLCSSDGYKDLTTSFNAQTYVDYFKFVFEDIYGFKEVEMYKWIKCSITDNTNYNKKGNNSTSSLC